MSHLIGGLSIREAFDRLFNLPDHDVQSFTLKAGETFDLGDGILFINELPCALELVLAKADLPFEKEVYGFTSDEEKVDKWNLEIRKLDSYEWVIFAIPSGKKGSYKCRIVADDERKEGYSVTIELK